MSDPDQQKPQGPERRMISVRLHLENGDTLELSLAEDSPETEEDVFAQVAALQILLANRQLGKRLRRAGVRVVQASADRLALETLEAYLAMFH